MTTPPLTNPLLDPAHLAMMAQQAQQTAPPVIRPPSAESAPPPIGRTNELGDPSGSTNEFKGMLPSSAPPAIKPTQADTDKTELARKVNTGSGISQISGKIQGAMPNHPLVGKLLGGAAQGLATLGDVGLRSVAPAVDLALPGTSLHHLADIHQGNKQVAADEATQESEAQQAEHGATTEHTKVETAALPQSEADKHALANATIGNLESETTDRDKTANEPSLAVAYAHAVNEEIKAGRDPQQSPIVQHLSDAITNLQKQPVAKGSEHINVVGPDGKPMIASYDPTTKKTYDSNGKELINPQPYEKPPQVNVNAGDASLDRLAGRLSKPYQTGFDAANASLEKIDKTMRSIDSGYKGQSLALPETMTALVSGQGTGVRITQAELNAIGSHNGVKGDIESFFTRISGQGSMTDEDKRQLKGILAEARQKILVKQQIYKEALDGTNGAADRSSVAKADRDARQKISDYETKGFFVGQRLPQGVVVGFSPNGKVQVDDAR